MRLGWRRLIVPIGIGEQGVAQDIGGGGTRKLVFIVSKGSSG